MFASEICILFYCYFNKCLHECCRNNIPSLKDKLYTSSIYIFIFERTFIKVEFGEASFYQNIDKQIYHSKCLRQNIIKSVSMALSQQTSMCKYTRQYCKYGNLQILKPYFEIFYTHLFNQNLNQKCSCLYNGGITIHGVIMLTRTVLFL